MKLTSRIESELPSRASPKTEMEELIRTKLRQLMPEPTLSMSIMLIEEPIRDTP
jgi:hypothetical protein